MNSNEGRETMKKIEATAKTDKSCPCRIALLGEEERKLCRADFLIFLKILTLCSSSN